MLIGLTFPVAFTYDSVLVSCFWVGQNFQHPRNLNKGKFILTQSSSSQLAGSLQHVRRARQRDAAHPMAARGGSRDKGRTRDKNVPYPVISLQPGPHVLTTPSAE